jgi:hypothetical protein
MNDPASQESENQPCDRSNDSSKRAKGHSLSSTNAAASVGKRRKLYTTRESTDTSTSDRSLIPRWISHGGLYQNNAPLQDIISDPLLAEKNLPKDPLLEASWGADDLFVYDQDKIPGNSSSTPKTNGSRAKLSRLRDFAFDTLAEVDEAVDGDFLFDTARSENTRPRWQQNPKPDILLIWKQREDRPANLAGLPRFPLLEEEEEEEEIVRYSMVIPSEPATTA